MHRTKLYLRGTDTGAFPIESIFSQVRQAESYRAESIERLLSRKGPFLWKYFQFSHCHGRICDLLHATCSTGIQRDASNNGLRDSSTALKIPKIPVVDFFCCFIRKPTAVIDISSGSAWGTKYCKRNCWHRCFAFQWGYLGRQTWRTTCYLTHWFCELH